MNFVSEADIKQLIESSNVGKNTKFLYNSHSLWTRFKNYSSSPPIALKVEDEIVCVIFATFNKDKYTNLYDIVTTQGNEGKGYASLLWDDYVNYAVNEKSSTRLKISCTPDSITWHLRNGLVFWGVDKSGSLRSDQPLFKNREEQLIFRKLAVDDPKIAMPSDKTCEKLRKDSLENHKFSDKKKEKIEEAISKVGKYWLRSELFNYGKLFD